MVVVDKECILYPAVPSMTVCTTATWKTHNVRSRIEVRLVSVIAVCLARCTPSCNSFAHTSLFFTQNSVCRHVTRPHVPSELTFTCSLSHTALALKISGDFSTKGYFHWHHRSCRIFTAILAAHGSIESRQDTPLPKSSPRHHFPNPIISNQHVNQTLLWKSVPRTAHKGFAHRL
jgi:hypothetical protein